MADDRIYVVIYVHEGDNIPDTRWMNDQREALKFLVYEWLSFRDVVSEEAVDEWLDGIELHPDLDIEVTDPYGEGSYGAIKSAGASEELFTDISLEDLYGCE